METQNGGSAPRRRRFAVDASLIKADANRQNGVEGDKGLPAEAAGRAIDEYLAVLDDAAFGAATEIVPKFISPSDPAARWTGAHGGQAFFGYSANYLIDVEKAIIVDVEPTTAFRQAAVLATRRMIERTAKNFALHPCRLLGDSAYDSAEMLGWLVDEQGIEPHVTVFDKSARKDGTFSRENFNYDQTEDVYICPGGKRLTTTGSRVNDGDTLLYRAIKADCDACALRSRCCPSTPARKVPRSIHEHAATRRVRSPGPRTVEHRDVCARSLKCSSLTSNAFLNWTDCDYQTAPMTSSSSQQPPQNLRKLAKPIPMPQPKPA